MSVDIDDVTTGKFAAGLLEASDHALRAMDCHPSSKARLLAIRQAIDELGRVLDLMDEACEVALAEDANDGG